MLLELDASEKDGSVVQEIRSYVLALYRMVKDLRTSHEVGNVDVVLDGELDDFSEAYLGGTLKKGGVTDEADA
jgi:peptide chain release factor 2